VLIEERAAVFVARAARAGGAAVVAWDGSDGSSRAARRATPLLRRASAVVIAGAPSERACDPNQLRAYYALRGIEATVAVLDRAGADTAAELLELAQGQGADLIVAGAFGRSRLREFIFGGVTRVLLHADGPSLFLAH
jgi:nucleotide-binding universal stress UspA family protein